METPTPSELICFLRRYVAWKPAILPLGFHEVNLYALTLDDILRLPFAEDGMLYIITPCPGPEQRIRWAPGGFWELADEIKEFQSAKGRSRLLSLCTGSFPQVCRTHWCMREYTLDEQLNPNLALCAICTTKMIQYQQHEEEGMWGADEMEDGSSDGEFEYEFMLKGFLAGSNPSFDRSHEENNKIDILLPDVDSPSPNWDEACLDDTTRRLQRCSLRRR